MTPARVTLRGDRGGPTPARAQPSSRWLVVMLLVASSCASPSTATESSDGSAEPDSLVADGATPEGADAQRAILPPDRFLDLDYEALVEDREAQTRRLSAFCGLDWDEACRWPEQNDRVVATASLWQVRQPVYRGAIGRWRNHTPWLGSLLRVAPAEEALG
jgi:hypothetical protein